MSTSNAKAQEVFKDDMQLFRPFAEVRSPFRQCLFIPKHLPNALKIAMLDILQVRFDLKP